MVTLTPQCRIDEALLKSMCHVIRHRGPDDEGIHLVDWSGGQVALGNRRLSIIDVAGGHQPMSNEDGTVWVICNGEIYNFGDLRDRLIGQGHKLRTRCDTEVLVHLYEEKGTGLLEDLRGMFAFAIWDAEKERLFLARDRLGQKPLTYYIDEEGIVFGSSIKSILQAPRVPRTVNPDALHHYLTFQYVPHPLTMFRGIQKVPPAHYLLYERGRAKVERYWLPAFAEERDVSEAKCVERLRGVLEEATRLRLISDVPLGAFLSGGIDSSIVVGIMSRLSATPVKTFSIGFEEENYDELAYARAAAARFHTDHKEYIVVPKAVEVIPEIVWHFDEPFGDSSAVPTYYVSKITRENVTVALSGDAGDECFAGYPRYNAMRFVGLADRVPRPLKSLLSRVGWGGLSASVDEGRTRRRIKKLLRALAHPASRTSMTWVSILDEDSKRFLYTEDFASEVGGADSHEFIAQYHEMAGKTDFVGRTIFADLMGYLPGDILTKVDIMSMANSLEVRSPFLDHKVVELAAAIPTRLKLRGKTGKYILKRAFGDLLPERIRTRGKRGFSIPIHDWFRHELADYMKDVLLDTATIQRGYLRRKAVERLIEHHMSGKWDNGNRLWLLLMLELWHREFIDRRPRKG
ncbi:MAG: asparagine synthase (glutamine-hydrolyzing) [Planctomycetes bacterium]|nr:asparagine synthase (glutamine-hydrolyzing) [Planctomycetota bacterium]